MLRITFRTLPAPSNVVEVYVALVEAHPRVDPEDHSLIVVDNHNIVLRTFDLRDVIDVKYTPWP